MKKLLVLLMGVMFLSGCDDAPPSRYKVEMTHCSTGKVDTISIVLRSSGNDPFCISTYKEAVPIFQAYGSRIRLLNICEYRILSKELVSVDDNN